MGKNKKMDINFTIIMFVFSICIVFTLTLVFIGFICNYLRKEIIELEKQKSYIEEENKFLFQRTYELKDYVVNKNTTGNDIEEKL